MSSFQSTSTTAQHQPSQQSQNNDHTTSSPSGATKAIGGLRRLASDPQQLNAYMDVIERLENTFRNTAHTSVSYALTDAFSITNILSLSFFLCRTRSHHHTDIPNHPTRWIPTP